MIFVDVSIRMIIKISNLYYQMNTRFNILFKLACASMFAGVSMGARFGHEGQLDEDGVKLFHKAQLYNTTNGMIYHMQLWGSLGVL
jgi:hypothetical protein